MSSNGALCPVFGMTAGLKMRIDDEVEGRRTNRLRSIIKVSQRGESRAHAAI